MYASAHDAQQDYTRRFKLWFRRLWPVARSERCEPLTAGVTNL